jgi:hypothetical protein
MHMTTATLKSNISFCLEEMEEVTKTTDPTVQMSVKIIHVCTKVDFVELKVIPRSRVAQSVY